MRRDPGYVVTNGPAESPDGRTLYHTDTLAGVIYAFDRAGDGSLTNKRVFARIEAGEGYPDGPIVDAEGCVWTGVFGGWGLQRYSPSGELLTTLRLPCSAVTKAAFGGDDLRTLYITTAHVALGAGTAPGSSRSPAACSARASTCRDCRSESCRMASDAHTSLDAASARATGSTIRSTSTWWRCTSSAS